MALHKYYNEKKSNQDPKQEVDRLQRDYEKFKKLKMMELEALERQKALKDQKRSLNASSKNSKKNKSKKNRSQNNSSKGTVTKTDISNVNQPADSNAKTNNNISRTSQDVLLKPPP